MLQAVRRIISLVVGPGGGNSTDVDKTNQNGGACGQSRGS